MLPEETRQSLSARLLSCQTRTGLGVYLAINLSLSLLANAYNRRIALVER